MQQSVVLRHDVHDGAFHFDWMIDQPEVLGEYRLRCWRCDVRPDLSEITNFVCLELPSHRAAYLTYEGEISGDRGLVRRLASGTVTEFEIDENKVGIVIVWGDRRMAYHGQRDKEQADRWRFEVRDLPEEDQE